MLVSAAAVGLGGRGFGLAGTGGGMSGGRSAGLALGRGFFAKAFQSASAQP